MTAAMALNLPYRPCVGIMLINRDGQVWVGRRLPKWIGDRSAFIWQMPQGGISAGEETRAAALRELEEETGVTTVEVLAEAPVWLSYELPEHLLGVALKGRYRGQRQKWFAMRFLGSDSEIDIAARGGRKAEFDDWRWAPVEDVPCLAVPFKRQIYEDVLAQSGVIRARSLRDLLDFARGVPILPTPKGENVLIITGAGGSGVLLSDACVDNKLSLMAMPPDLDAAFRKFIPPFGAAGNPVDITGGEPPKTYQNTVKLGLEDPRIHSLILGYWHTIITPPMVFAKLIVEVKQEMKAKGIEKPMVASLAGDVQVEEAAEYLYAHGVPAYAYSTEIPVAVLGAKYKWARGAGLL